MILKEVKYVAQENTAQAGKLRNNTDLPEDGFYFFFFMSNCVGFIQRPSVLPVQDKHTLGLGI